MDAEQRYENVVHSMRGAQAEYKEVLAQYDLEFEEKGQQMSEKLHKASQPWLFALCPLPCAACWRLLPGPRRCGCMLFSMQKLCHCLQLGCGMQPACRCAQPGCDTARAGMLSRTRRLQAVC